MTLMSAASGPIADALMSNPMLTSTDVRKMFTCIGRKKSPGIKPENSLRFLCTNLQNENE